MKATPEQSKGKRNDFAYYVKVLVSVVGLAGAALGLYQQWKKTQVNEGPLRYVKHKIRKGESISKIAISYGASIEETISLNLATGRIKNPDIIFPGKTILIPIRNSTGIIIDLADGKYMFRSQSKSSYW